MPAPETLSLYVKYSKSYPYLPEAVADTAAELARMVETNPHVIWSSISHGRSTYAKVDYIPDMHPDNDGGAWFYDPITGDMVTVRD